MEVQITKDENDTRMAGDDHVSENSLIDQIECTDGECVRPVSAIESVEDVDEIPEVQSTEHVHTAECGHVSVSAHEEENLSRREKRALEKKREKEQRALNRGGAANADIARAMSSVTSRMRPGTSLSDMANPSNITEIMSAAQGISEAIPDGMDELQMMTQIMSAIPGGSKLMPVKANLAQIKPHISADAYNRLEAKIGGKSMIKGKDFRVALMTAAAGK